MSFPKSISVMANKIIMKPLPTLTATVKVDLPEHMQSTWHCPPVGDEKAHRCHVTPGKFLGLCLPCHPGLAVAWSTLTVCCLGRCGRLINPNPDI